MVFSYEIYTTYATPNGNVTNISTNKFTVDIFSVNVSAPHGEVGYAETVQEFNSTTVTSSSLFENFTTIFDPYDNFSYMGNIGFYPFTYADLPNGSVHNLGVNITVTNVPYGNGTATLSSVQYVNATVARSPGSIDVNLTTVASPGEMPSVWVMRFNSTTGVLKYAKTTTNLESDIEKIFTYALVSYSHASPPPPSSPSLLPYLALVVVAVVAAVLVVARRKSPRERKVERMRERLRTWR